MENWQYLIILIYTAINLAIVYRGFLEIKVKRNAFGLTRPLAFLGMFVWGDAIVIGIFWIFSCLIVLLLKDWYLFLVIISVFWVVRSLGEVVYWLNQQFSKINRNPPESLLFGSFFPAESIWFVNQVFWQCVAVFSIIFSIYFTKIWLN